MADCLLRIYQDKLFRGDQGGRSWSDYLAKEIGLLGYGKLSTELAADELNWEVLCKAIDEWNQQNPHKVLGYPKGRSYLDGWTTLFDRSISKGGGTNVYAIQRVPCGQCAECLENRLLQARR